MKKLTSIQVAHFVYWLFETYDGRGIRQSVENNHHLTTLSIIENDLLNEFFKKYPLGLLTGFE